MTYEGRCHCGKIAYAVEGEIDALLECNCSICSRKGYRSWSVDLGPSAISINHYDGRSA